MNIGELVLVAIESIKSNRLRSFLTTLGIVIGIAAVIAVVGIGQGGRAMLMQEMEKFGTNLFGIWVNYQEGETMRPGDLQMTDITIIKEKVPQVKYLAPATYEKMQLRGEKGQKSVQIIGTNADYAQIRNLKTRWGRFIRSDDAAAGRRVIVLDEKTAQNLFGSGNPVGKRVMLMNNSAVVVGVIKNDSSTLGFSSQQIAYLPWSFLTRLTDRDIIHEFQGSAVSKEEVEPAMNLSKKILERRHNSPDHYFAYSMEQEMEAANKVTGIMTLIIGCIAGISLLVGGIGVMNIMLVSVTERTREIGIRMALGARRRDILVQFIIESIVLCLLGGLIGIILGYGGAMLIARLAKWPPLVSWWTIVVAFIFSMAVGLFFGIYPANQASKLDPIEALRRD
ncbi:MAG: FtsX-like permease family protein [Syntrophomonadaceae bacterium]|jgi:putative ABC transport system permease protein|nr:FtsX-like permease family protein [Syntrophomonadaceae bacterium]